MKKLFYFLLFLTTLAAPKSFCAMVEEESPEQTEALRIEKQDLFIQSIKEALPEIPTFLRSRAIKIHPKGRWQDVVTVGRTIKSLKFINDPNLTDELLTIVSSLCPNLENLSIAWCNNVTDKGLLGVAQGCPKIRWLGIYGCNAITDSGIQQIALRCDNITWMNLSRRSVTNIGLLAIIKSCKKLATLIVQECNELDNSALYSITPHCKNLIELDLIGCDNLSSEAIRDFCRALPNVAITLNDSEDEDSDTDSDRQMDESINDNDAAH